MHNSLSFWVFLDLLDSVLGDKAQNCFPQAWEDPRESSLKAWAGLGSFCCFL